MYSASQAGGRGQLTSWQVDSDAKTEKRRNHIKLRFHIELKYFLKAATKNTSYSKKGWLKNEQPTQFPKLNQQNIICNFNSK
jgi:hypothetical protein